MIDNQKINHQNLLKNSKTYMTMNLPTFSISRQENFDIEKIKSFNDNYNFLNKKAEYNSFKNLEENNNKLNINLETNRETNQEIFNRNDHDLILSLIPSKPEKREEINLSDAIVNSESFEINIDLLDRVNTSGGLNKLSFHLNKKE